MLSIALLPIGLISLYQTRSVVEKAEALTRSAYLGQTVAAAERQSDLIHEGFASARVLGGAILSMEIDLASVSGWQVNLAGISTRRRAHTCAF